MNVLDDDELVAMYEQMKEVEGATLDFTIHRDAQHKSAQPGTTFSAEALERIHAAARVWLWTRCFRALGDGAQTHGDLRYSVTVEIDGEQEAGVPVVMEILDGSLRFRAATGEDL